MKFLFAFLYCLSSPFAYGKLKVSMSQGIVQPDPIAVVPFVNGEEVSKVILSDLESSGLFRGLDSEGFIQDAQSLLSQGVRLSDWKILKTRFLVYGKCEESFGQIESTFYLWDILRGKNLLSLQLKTSKSNTRKLAHMIADEIYTTLTNEKGFFNTHIIYVESLPQKRGKPKQTRLVRIDSDGSNPYHLTAANENIVNPSYSSDGQYLLYSVHKKNIFCTYLMNLSTGKSKQLLQSKDSNFAARFSPDNMFAVLTISKDGKSAIYEVELTTGKLRALTSHTSIDTSPSYSPDGEHILFTSDRAGSERIFVMDRQGQNVQLLTKTMGKYSQPIWSPRKDMIGFIKQEGKIFFVGVMKTDGSEERYIDSGHLIERIAWAPNGRYLLYSKKSNHDQPHCICRSDATGLAKGMVPIAHDARDATWSPLYKVKTS